MTIDIRKQWKQASKIEKILIGAIILTGINTAALSGLNVDSKYVVGAMAAFALSSIIGYEVCEYKRYQGMRI